MKPFLYFYLVVVAAASTAAAADNSTSSSKGDTIASSLEMQAICYKYQGTANGTIASDNFMQGCTQQLLVKDSPVTNMKQCTKGKAILSAFESTTCKRGANLRGALEGGDGCSCNVLHGIECAAGVAGCGVACAASLGVGCVACVVGLGATCCECACDAFGCGCGDC